MADEKIYKVIEVVGTSERSFSDAVANAIKRAAQTVESLQWFEVLEERGRIQNDSVEVFQVTVKVGFRLKD